MEIRESPQCEDFPHCGASSLVNREISSVGTASETSGFVQAREAFMRKAGGVVAILAGISGAIHRGYEAVRLSLSEEFMELSYATEVLGTLLGSVAIFIAIAALGVVAITTKVKGTYAAVPLILSAIAASLLDAQFAMVFAAQAVVGASLVFFDKKSRHGA